MRARSAQWARRDRVESAWTGARARVRALRLFRSCPPGACGSVRMAEKRSRPSVRCMLRIVAIALVALVVAAALAAADEVAAGRAIAAQLQQGSIGCSELTGTHSERLGEYAMELMAG